MNRSDKIKALENRLDALSAPKAVSLTEQLIQEEMENLRVDIGNRVSTKAIESVRTDMAAFSDKFKLEPVFEAISKADTDNKNGIMVIQKDFEKRLNDFIQANQKVSGDDRKASKLSRAEILGQITDIRSSFDEKLSPLFSRDALLAAEIDRLQQDIRRIDMVFKSNTASVDAIEALNSTKELQKALIDLEKRLLSRIGSLNNHGGNMNRNIALNGNTSVLGRYTDINLKAGANVTLTAVANNTTKYTDITIASSGGGSSTIYNDTVSGTIDGANKTFTVPSSIIGAIALFLSNTMYQNVVDYTFSGSTITFGAAPDASLSGQPFWLAHT